MLSVMLKLRSDTLEHVFELLYAKIHTFSTLLSSRSKEVSEDLGYGVLFLKQIK